MNLLSSLFGSYWRNKQSSNSQPADFAPNYGAFVPTYYVNLFARPKTNEQAQNLYNHTRTVAWYMDALPFLSQTGLPVKIGMDDIVSAIPIWGDFVGVLLALYQVFLSFLFGVSQPILVRMVVNVVIDGIIGIVPLIGDLLDVLFKSNLRNLELLEDWLIKEAPQYQISIPPSKQFLPKLKKGAKTWNKASGEPDPRDKYRNLPRTARMQPADLD
ncbi:hypothetical protein FRB95_002981 [Tulasnella sp. JGI-2019a]|nr:hypothetical protein FRB95_002981 [Tulasnella sp. JGI-2019a]